MAVKAVSSGPVKAASFIMFCFFAYACSVQVNDPDCLVWMSVYGIASLSSLASSLGLNSIMQPLATLAGADAALVLLTGLGGHSISLDVDTECGRETGGLVIVILWSLLTLLLASGSDLSPVGALGLFGAALAVLASAILIPMLMMSREKLVEPGWWPGVGSPRVFMEGSATV